MCWLWPVGLFPNLDGQIKYVWLVILPIGFHYRPYVGYIHSIHTRIHSNFHAEFLNPLSCRGTVSSPSRTYWIFLGFLQGCGQDVKIFGALGLLVHDVAVHWVARNIGHRILYVNNLKYYKWDNDESAARMLGFWRPKGEICWLGWP